LLITDRENTCRVERSYRVPQMKKIMNKSWEILFWCDAPAKASTFNLRSEIPTLISGLFLNTQVRLKQANIRPTRCSQTIIETVKIIVLPQNRI